MQNQDKQARKNKLAWLQLLVLGLIFTGSISNLSQAKRFGINTGIYNDRVDVGYASSREIGLRLGFYVDDTVHDIIQKNSRINPLENEVFPSDLEPCCEEFEPIVRQQNIPNQQIPAPHFSGMGMIQQPALMQAPAPAIAPYYYPVPVAPVATPMMMAPARPAAMNHHSNSIRPAAPAPDTRMVY